MRSCRVQLVSALCAVVATTGRAQAKDPPPPTPNAEAQAQGEPTRAPLRASVNVDTAPLGEDGDGLGQQLETELGSLLRTRDVLPRKSLTDGIIFVRVSRGRSKRGYHIEVYAMLGDARVEGSSSSQECRRCEQAELLSTIGATVTQCLKVLAAQAQQAPDAPREVVSDPLAETSGPQRDSGEPFEQPVQPRLGKLGWVGVGTAGVGAAALGVGIAFIFRGRTVSTDPGAVQVEGVDFRPAGIGVAAAGGVLLVTGVALLLVDLRRRKRSSMRASIAPYPAGLAITGVF